MPTAVSVPVSPATQLWGKAFNSLSEDVRNRLLSLKAHPGDVLVAVRDEAEKGRQKCLRSRFKFTRSTGEVVIVRDVLEKIVRWVDRFKEIGDTAVQYNPEVAALPWAAVRFVLQSAVSEIQYFGSVIADLEIISRLITRQTEFERQLSGQTSSGFHDALSEARVGLYAEILTHLARFQKFFGESTAVRIAKGPFRDIDNDRMRSVLEREDEVLKISNMVGMETLQRLEAAFTRLSVSAVDSSLVLADEKFRQVRDWLSLSPYNRHHAYISESRLPGTGQWLLNHAQYADWLTSSCSSVLLLHGIIGSGKSTLTSLVIDALNQTAAYYPSPAPLAFFYCANSDWERNRASADSVMRTLLWQLCLDASGETKVRESLLAEYERKAAMANIDGFDIPRLRTQDCVRLVLELAQQDPLTIIVDALDTLDQKERYALTKALSEIVSKADNVVKVFVSTRTDTHLRSTLIASNYINITAEDTHADMITFIEHRIDTIDSNQWLLDVSSSLHDTLVQFLLENAGEMFLWVRLQVDRIACEHFEADVKSILESGLPTDLHTVYDDIMNRIMSIGAQARKTATRLLIWVLHAKEPLPPSAIISALATSHDSLITYDQLARLCANMIVVDDKCNVLRFAHQSFQEFLTKQDGFSAAESHGIIASDCIDACSLGLEDPEEQIFPLATFHDYATIYWLLHFAQAQGSSSYPKIFLKARSFLFDDDFDASLAFAAWLYRLRIVSPLIPDDHALKTRLNAIPDSDFAASFLMSAFGMSDLLETFPVGILKTSVNQKNELGHRPLYLAAVFGHAMVVTHLVQHGAEINIECGKFGSPLHAACFSGHAEVVRQLLERNADVGCGAVFKDALEASCRGGQEGIALLLVQRDIAESSEADWELAMQQAAQAGFLRVADFLQLAPSAQARGDANKIMKKTSKAIQFGQVGILRRLLGDKSDITSLLPTDAVALATLHNQLDMAEYLIDKGLSIEANGVFGSPLRTAAIINSASLFRLLLDRKADANASGPFGDAMQAAAAKGHTSILRILLAEQFEQHHTRYDAALQAAAYHGQVAAVELLLDAETTKRSQYSLNHILYAATDGGHSQVAVMLRKRGHKIAYRMPLLARYPMIQTRLRPLHPFRQSTFRQSNYDPLKFGATNFSFEAMVRISEAEAAYIPASLPDHLHVRQDFLSDLSKINPASGIVTPSMVFYSAVLHGHTSVVRHLVEKFAFDVNLATFSGNLWAALPLAVSQELHSVSMVRLLLGYGASIPSSGRERDEVLCRLMGYFRCDCRYSTKCCLQQNPPCFESHFKESRCLEDVFEDGPGAVLGLLLFLEPGRKANDYGPELGLALQMACSINNHDFVDQLLDRQVDINTVTPCYGTALQAAIFMVHTSMAQKLLRAGADIYLGHGEHLQYTKRRSAWGPSHLRQENPEFSLTVESWFNCRAPVGSMRNDCMTSPIHTAAFRGQLDMVTELLSRGADVNQPGVAGVRPLTLASAGGHLQTIRALIDAGADLECSRALCHAIHPQAVEELLSRGAKITPKLDLAYKGGHNEADLDYLCQVVQNSCSNDTWDAVINNSLESQHTTDSIFPHLLAYTTSTMKLLILACKKGFLSSVKHMIEPNKFDINGWYEESGSSPFHAAVSMLQAEVVSYLITMGAEVNSTHATLPPPLEVAMNLQRASLEDEEYIRKRRKLQIQEHWERQNLCIYFFDQKSQREETVRLLVDNGADLNNDSQPPGPPLHLACLSGSGPMVGLLLDAGASAGTTAGKYEQAIFAAIEGGELDIVKLILSRSPQTGYRHSKHGTPQEYVRSIRTDDNPFESRYYDQIQTLLEESNQV